VAEGCLRQEAQRQAVVELSWLIVLAAKSPIKARRRAAASSGPGWRSSLEMMISAVSGATTPLK
jgi:hypothetical protein